MANHQFDVDELTLILDNLQANIQAENQDLREIYEAKKKACEEATEKLKIQNQFLLDIKELRQHIKELRQQSQFILKAIHASHASLRSDHYLLIELLNFVLKNNGNGNSKKLEYLLEQIKARQYVNFNFDIPKNGDSTTIQTGDQTHLDLNQVGGDSIKK